MHIPAHIRVCTSTRTSTPHSHTRTHPQSLTRTKCHPVSSPAGVATAARGWRLLAVLGRCGDGEGPEPLGVRHSPEPGRGRGGRLARHSHLLGGPTHHGLGGGHSHPNPATLRVEARVGPVLDTPGQAPKG